MPGVTVLSPVPSRVYSEARTPLHRTHAPRLHRVVAPLVPIRNPLGALPGRSRRSRRDRRSVQGSVTTSIPAGSPEESGALPSVQVYVSVARAAAIRAAMLDALPAPVCLIGPDGIILATNAPWRRITETAPGGPLPWGGVGAGYLRVIHTLATSGRESQRPLWKAVEILDSGGGIPRGPVAHPALGLEPAGGRHAIHLIRIPLEAGGGYLATHVPHPGAGAGTDSALPGTPLRQARKLEALGQLTGGIAHEINNVLTVILSGVDTVMEEHAPSPEARLELTGVRQAAWKGAETVRRLLTFSRRHGDTRRTVDLGEVVGGMQDLLERVLPGSITLRIKVEDASPLVVAGPGDVEEMLLNLASNARDSMPGAGVLEVWIRRARLGIRDARQLGLPEPGEYVALVVRDTGSGMDATTLERAFEPFYSTKEVDGGSGLGLSLIYGLMREHGGTVVIRSTQGAGTTVTLWFPAAVPPGERAPLPLLSPGSGGRESILLVEDDGGIRAAATRILEKAGYRVTPARDGQEAIDFLAADTFQVDLVVSDVVMPRAGGAAVHQAAGIRARPPRFLFMSGYAAHDLRGSRSLPPGVPLLPKPWTATELLQAVRIVLDGGQWEQGQPPLSQFPPDPEGSS